MRRLTSSGFTLIEVVVATAIMGTIVAAAGHVVLLAAERSVAHRRQLQALVLVQSKLEELRAAPGAAAGGEDRHGSLVRRWSAEPVDSASPAALLLRACIGAPPVCVATVRVRR